ncbi:MAG: hypothetical protein KDB00_08895 [Planctomycetales bacterium]|nr:hypothetical protein [Planctomycetales bacterium]
MRPAKSAVFLFLLASLIPHPLCPGDEAADARLKQMVDRATSMEIRFSDPTLRPQPVKLVATPLHRYSDQPRQILDGSFWCWESEGRPIAFEKIEYYDKPVIPSGWFYCFASVAEHPISAQWNMGLRWNANGPGVEFQTIDNEPAPQQNTFRTSLQLKKLSQRFSVRLDDPVAKTGEQLRLIPRPIYEYGQSKDAKATGAVFRFASNGTNPDALLLIEYADTESGSQWRYGWVQMTTGQLTARLDDQVVWTAPYQKPSSAKPSMFDSWLFFYETVAGQ